MKNTIKIAIFTTLLALSTSTSAADYVSGSLQLTSNSFGGALTSANNNIYAIDSSVNTVAVFDANTHIKKAQVAVPSGSSDIIALNNKVFVTSYASSVVTVINTNTNTIEAFIQTPVQSHPIRLAVGASTKRTGSKVYVAYDGLNTLSVIDPTTNTITNSITLTPGFSPTQMYDVGSKMYVLGYGSNKLASIDTKTNTVSYVQLQGPAQALVANGSKLYITNSSGSTVSVLDINTDNFITSVYVGNSPWALATIGTRVYVTLYNTGKVAIIDTNTNTLVGTVTVGQAPIALATLGSKVYVANSESNSVSSIDTMNNNAVEILAVGAFPQGFTTSGQKVYVSNFDNSFISVISQNVTALKNQRKLINQTIEFKNN